MILCVIPISVRNLITLREFRNVVSKLKDGKAVGIWSITAELVKFGCVPMLSKLLSGTLILPLVLLWVWSSVSGHYTTQHARQFAQSHLSEKH